MSCGCRYRNMRSAQTAYNSASQSFAATGTTIAILGTVVTDTGVAIETMPSAFKIDSTGLYRVSYDVDFTSGAAGTATLQLYNGLTPLPCAVAERTVVDGTEYAVHVETTLTLNSCYGVQPSINAQISGVTGTVTHVCASAVKLS